MKPKFYEVLLTALHDGVESGWEQAHKHYDKPNPRIIKHKMTEEVLAALHNYFNIPSDFDD